MVRSFLLCLMTFLVSCTYYGIVSTPVLISAGLPPAEPLPESWVKYGACYLYDELFVEASSSSPSFYAMPVNTIIYNKKLRILSKEGETYGTVQLPVYNSGPKRFRVTLVNAGGDTLPLDVKKLRRELVTKGEIVVPNVTPGCEITLYVEYETNEPILFFEHTFIRQVPVLLSKFTFSTLSSLHYDFKSYNIGQEPEISHKSGGNTLFNYTYHTYELRKLVPYPELDFMGYTVDTEKWVAIVLREAMRTPVFTNWAVMASRYNRHYFPTDVGYSENRTGEIVAAVKEKKKDDLAVADSLLQWVLEHIILDESDIKVIRLSRVIESQKGNLWEITELLRELFKKAGFTTSVVITRSKEMGGFDRDFVAPMPLVVPLLVVTVNNCDYVAFPFRRGAKLGEYPNIFNCNYGLSIDKEKPVMLPRSLVTDAGSCAKFTIDCRNEEPEQRVDFTLYNGFAYSTRTFLRTIEVKKHQEFLQKWLTDLGTSNALGNSTIDGIFNSGAPLSFHATFSNPNQIIKKDNLMHIKLSNLFDKYFKSYDTLRQEDLINVQSVDDTETVYVISDGANVVPVFECHECRNRLFTVACTTAASKDTTMLRRITHIDSVTIGRDEMKLIYPDILANNRISESGITVIKSQKRKLSNNTKRVHSIKR